MAYPLSKEKTVFRSRNVYMRIFLPVSLPSLATVALFTMVFHWNSFFDGYILMNTPDKWPLQTYIQQLSFVINSAKMATIDRKSVV